MFCYLSSILTPKKQPRDASVPGRILPASGGGRNPRPEDRGLRDPLSANDELYAAVLGASVPGIVAGHRIGFTAAHGTQLTRVDAL